MCCRNEDALDCAELARAAATWRKPQLAVRLPYVREGRCPFALCGAPRIDGEERQPTNELRRLREALTMHRELGGTTPRLSSVISVVEALESEALAAAEHLEAPSSGE